MGVLRMVVGEAFIALPDACSKCFHLEKSSDCEDRNRPHPQHSVNKSIEASPNFFLRRSGVAIYLILINSW